MVNGRPLFQALSIYVWRTVKFVLLDLVCFLLVKVLLCFFVILLFVVTYLEQYASITEYIEKCLVDTLNCIHHIIPSFSYSPSHLTMEQAKQLLQQTVPSPDCDSNNGMYPTCIE